MLGWVPMVRLGGRVRGLEGGFLRGWRAGVRVLCWDVWGCGGRYDGPRVLMSWFLPFVGFPLAALESMM